MSMTAIDTELKAIANNLRRSTVLIRSGQGSGSGVIWRNGLIITNAHVVTGVTVQLADGILNAQVIAKDLRRDLAAIRVTAANSPAVTVSYAPVRTGELVLAVGNPFMFPGAFSIGTIYASNNPQKQSWIRANIRLFPGNSGGPLANAQGHVLGINTMIAYGLALAVPSQEVEHFLSAALLI